MRVLACAVALSSAFFVMPVCAEPTVLPPIKIVVKPARPLVTEIAAPQKSLLVADPPPSFAARVAPPVSGEPF